MRMDKAAKQELVKRQIASVRQGQTKNDVLLEVTRYATVPLLTPTSRGGSYELLASGVLIKNSGHVFLNTAAHVLRAFSNREIVIPVRNGQLISLVGDGHGNEAFDAGILDIKNSDLAPLLDIALPAGVTFAQNELLLDRLVIYGFPARNFHRNGKIVGAHPGIFALRGKEASAYSGMNKTLNDFIIMNWPKKIYGPTAVVRSPSLAGMSGCGVWYVPQQTSKQLSIHAPGPMPRLIGIVIEQRRRHAAVVATNIRHHIELKYRHFPEILEAARSTYVARIAERLRVEENVQR
jgi:hypothetical protein